MIEAGTRWIDRDSRGGVTVTAVTDEKVTLLRDTGKVSEVRRNRFEKAFRRES